jgi:hypothetical protein
MTTIYPTTTKSASPREVVTGQFVAKVKLSLAGRAHYAALMSIGKMDLAYACLHQSAALWRVPVCQVQRAVRHLNGGNGNGKDHGRRNPTRRVDRLQSDLKNATAAELAAVGAAVGPAIIWDRLIAPVLDEERAATSAAAK